MAFAKTESISLADARTHSTSLLHLSVLPVKSLADQKEKWRMEDRLQ